MTLDNFNETIPSGSVTLTFLRGRLESSVIVDLSDRFLGAMKYFRVSLIISARFPRVDIDNHLGLLP